MVTVYRSGQAPCYALSIFHPKFQWLNTKAFNCFISWMLPIHWIDRGALWTLVTQELGLMSSQHFEHCWRKENSKAWSRLFTHNIWAGTRTKIPPNYGGSESGENSKYLIKETNDYYDCTESVERAVWVTAEVTSAQIEQCEREAITALAGLCYSHFPLQLFSNSIRFYQHLLNALECKIPAYVKVGRSKTVGITFLLDVTLRLLWGHLKENQQWSNSGPQIKLKYI